MTLSVSVRHSFSTFELDATFDAPDGITVLFGRSGSGKTTVINSVAGLLRPHFAKISMDGRPLHDTDRQIFVEVHKRRMGYVFQEARLFPHMSVAQNLSYGQRFAPGTTSVPTTSEVAELLGIEHLLDRAPASLSGGEKQRVAIGRALLARPQVLLMDEPLAALDAARKAEILPYLERLRDQVSLPILYVSHSVAEVARLATTMVVLEDGRVARTGPAEAILSDPDMVRQIGVREAGAVLPARIKRHHSDGLTELEASGGALFLPQMEAPVGTATRVRILAQDVILSKSVPTGLSALNILPVRIVALREGTGPGVVVQASAGEDKILARITRRSAEALEIKPGDTAYAVVKSVSIARVDIGTG